MQRLLLINFTEKYKSCNVLHISNTFQWKHDLFPIQFLQSYIKKFPNRIRAELKLLQVVVSVNVAANVPMTKFFLGRISFFRAEFLTNVSGSALLLRWILRFVSRWIVLFIEAFNSKNFNREIFKIQITFRKTKNYSRWRAYIIQHTISGVWVRRVMTILR